MSLIYQNSKEKFEKNKNKVFFDDLNKTLNGQECLYLIEKVSILINKKKIKNISIISKNCLCWPIWYIAADKFCERIFVLNPDLDEKTIKQIEVKNKIQLSINNPDLILSENFTYDGKIEDKINENQKSIRKDILFTSGTTNIPKGVVVDEKAFTYVANILIKKFEMNENDNELLSMPFYHSFGLTRLRCVLLSDSQAVITDGLKNFPKVYKASKEKKLTGISLVSSGIVIVKTLLKNKITEFSKNIKYFEIGSSSISKEIRDWLKDSFKSTKILHHYGMTEASRSFLREILLDNNDKDLENWVGEPIEGCKFKLSQINYETQDVGELMIKGLHLFDAYTEKHIHHNKFNNGWFKTGDICKIKKGKVFLLGRSDNQFNIGGNKVQAELIENIIEEIDEVKNSLCFSRKDNLLGEVMNCIIELKGNNDQDNFIKNIKEHFKNFPSYYLPEKFIFQKVIMTPNGKKIRK